MNIKINKDKDEQAKVQKNVEDANKGNFPAGTTVKVGADGKATVTYIKIKHRSLS